MREPARRGREAGALAGGAGEVAAGHVLALSFSRARRGESRGLRGGASRGETEAPSGCSSWLGP